MKNTEKKWHKEHLENKKHKKIIQTRNGFGMIEWVTNYFLPNNGIWVLTDQNGAYDFSKDENAAKVFEVCQKIYGENNVKFIEL